jgi:hypothetical protein
MYHCIYLNIIVKQISEEAENRIILIIRVLQSLYRKRFYALVVITVIMAMSIRFVTVNAVVFLKNSPEIQEKVLSPGMTDGVFDGVLMKMTDISYANLDHDVGDTLGSISESNSIPSGITKQISTVNQMYWHLTNAQASELYFSDLNSWKVIDVENAESIYGFYAIAFEQGNTVVIAYRGTDNVQDIMSDADIYLNIQGEVEQLRLAKQFVSEVQKSLPDNSYHVIFTGHSIGGWLAQQTYLDASRTSMSTEGTPLTTTAEPSLSSRQATWQSVHATVFNSIGTEFRTSTASSQAVKDYHFQGDVFSHFGTSLGEEIEVPNPILNESIYDKHQLYNFYGYFYPQTNQAERTFEQAKSEMNIFAC